MEANQKRAQFVLEVDPLDHPLGLVEKQKAHRQGILHRAFSIFVFRSQGPSLQLLLQKRAAEKYHSGGLWTNTCCGHAQELISLETAAKSRLVEEMGISCELYPAGSFYYLAKLDNEMIEHEIDHVFIATANPTAIRPNPLEVQDYQWQDVALLLEMSEEAKASFTVWFFPAFEVAVKCVGDRL